MKVKLDLHLHTVRSYDSTIDVGSLVAYTKLKGLDGVAITDHNTAPSRSLVEALSGRLLVVPGLEVKTEVGHMLGLGVFDVSVKGRVQAESFIELIHRLGGLVVAAHPNPLRLSDKRYVNLNGLDCVEVLNASLRPSRIAYLRNSRLAAKIGAVWTAGSDSHMPYTIGDAYTVIECDGRSWVNAVESLAEGRSTIRGNSSRFSMKLLKIGFRLSSLTATLGF